LHLGITQGLHVAVALQALLVHVHRKRYVDGKNELEIDGGLRLPGARQQHPEPGEHKKQ
jgi:hypothetical protein